MPKINVYLPDELAEAVKETGVPVSAICQRALEQAVRRVVAVRETALGDLTPDDLAERFPNLTPRTRAVLAAAIDAGAGGPVNTGHLLTAMINGGDNLGVRVLHAIDIDPAAVLADLGRRTDTETGQSARFSVPASGALELAVTEATAFGHNYVGCEHLLLGLVTEPDGVAGQVLRGRGAEPRLTRRATTAALSGYVHLRAQGGGEPAGMQAFTEALQQQLRPIIERIERLEQR
ncbi:MULTISPECIES: Clp protease N-terminal domain-containing protein [Actinoplanes]|uniref:Clp protease N-terminal domain-containing protein n=1 Tax=Actinoplanes TaxID=1865 RepID=UPI0005F2DCE7|nr:MULTISPECIES: Clp protease N-terminal domain-containing protein [Actinoplanes]